MTSRHGNRGSSRFGLIIAMVIGLGFASLIGYFVFLSPSGGQSVPEEDYSDVQSITDILGQTESGGGLNLQFADKDDPTRVAATLEADTIRPAESDGSVQPSLFNLERIRARVFFDSGETMLIESDSGQFFMPDRRAGPESGSLSGTPKISLFSKDDPDGEPILVADLADTLRFNFAYSHLETPGHIKVVGRGVEFAGTHLTARLNEQRERIDVLEVEKGEYLRYDPSVARQAASGGAGAPAPRPGVVVPAAYRAPARRQGEGFSAQPPPAPAAGPAVVPDGKHLAYYRATFSDSVELAQGHKRITADMLESWVRLIDHKLPGRTAHPASTPTALTPLRAVVLSALARTQDDGVKASAPPAGAPADGPGERAGADATGPVPLSGDELVTLTWTGMLRVVPLVNREPEQLALDDASFRFTATESGLVNLFDEHAGGHAAVVEYGATTRKVTLTGPGASVLLESDTSGWIEASRTIVHMDTGQVRVIGPGQVNSGDRADRSPTRRIRFVRWLDQADFAFAMNGRTMTGDIETASFSGQARAVDGDKRVDGDMFVASFADDGSGGRVIDRFDAWQMDATDGKGGQMTASRLSLPFEVAGPGRSEPSRVYASGAVSVSRDGKRLDAQTLSADLVKDANGALTVRNLIAERSVVFADGQSVTATADRLEADGLERLAVLEGADGEPASIVYADAVITGGRIDLSDQPQKLDVRGPGSFAQNRGAEQVLATWTTGMSFDRAAGVIECMGGASLSQQLATGQTRNAKGHSVTIELVDKGGELVFDAASIFGTGRSPATLESRTGGPGAQGPERMAHLTASEIMTTSGGDGLIVPVPGRLVLLDHRASGDGELDGWDRGHALLTWDSSLIVDRLRGTVRMVGSAHAIQKTDPDGRVAELAADTIDGTFVEGPAGAVELTRLDAVGTAYFRMDQREIIASVLRFDPENRRVDCLSDARQPVQMIDNTSGSVVRARSLLWDLATDRIELDQPGPLTLPRAPARVGAGDEQAAP